jgi:hypothetical protein
MYTDGWNHAVSAIKYTAGATSVTIPESNGALTGRTTTLSIQKTYEAGESSGWDAASYICRTVENKTLSAGTSYSFYIPDYWSY